MSFIRYKTFGNQEYAYEVTSYWDPKLKKTRQKQRYLGVVMDKENGVFKKKRKDQPKLVENLILDFGDVYLLYRFMEQVGLLDFVQGFFGDRADTLLSLICYRLCYPSAMQYAESWYTGSFSCVLFKEAHVSSQRISDFFVSIGDERVLRGFFQQYIPLFTHADEGVIIDSSSLPNQNHFPFTAWGYHSGGIDKQIRFLFVIDKKSNLPLFFRYLPGNVIDVSSLQVTMDELKQYQVNCGYVLLDAGFFSQSNIEELYAEEIDFFTRLPSSRKLFKQLIVEEAGGLECFDHAVQYGERALFIKKRRVDLFGRMVYAYIVLDPERKGRETKKVLLTALDDEDVDRKEVDFRLLKKGVMILVSSFEMTKEEVVPSYYVRQMVERLFGFSKDDLRLLPLRVHKEESLRGFLLLQFMSLVVFVLLKKAIGKDHTVEEILLTLRNLKCKVFDDEILVQELTRQQKEIVEQLDVMVPKKLGV